MNNQKHNIRLESKISQDIAKIKEMRRTLNEKLAMLDVTEKRKLEHLKEVRKAIDLNK